MKIGKPQKASGPPPTFGGHSGPRNLPHLNELDVLKVGEKISFELDSEEEANRWHWSFISGRSAAKLRKIRKSGFKARPAWLHDIRFWREGCVVWAQRVK